MDMMGRRMSEQKGNPTVVAAAAAFPPNCTVSQRESVAKVSPMAMTACPDNTWLLEDNETTKAITTPTTTTRSLLRSMISGSDNKEDRPILFEPSHGRPPLGMFVGCNKGIDAVDTLRFLSQNTIYDKKTWIHALDLPNPKGVCNTNTKPQITIEANQHPRQAKLYCIEAMPSTFGKLQQATQKLGWQESFVVHHAAMSNSNGYIPFPNHETIPGYESLGIEDCETKPEICQNVALYTLDTFFEQHVQEQQLSPATTILDFLSIDVEGFDIFVLRGAKSTLQKTKYVEFEVHNKGAWKNVPLETAITELEQQDFVCYYAGTGGKLWRLTDCMTGPLMNIWSNVACVNVRLAPNLAQHMEDIFLKTIENWDHTEAQNRTMTLWQIIAYTVTSRLKE